MVELCTRRENLTAMKRHRAGKRGHRIRIIGGCWRHRQLTVCDTPTLRPSPDRLRETLFNWLQPDITDANCLDMFAGSGALGFEAVSRGAARVLMVERDVRLFQQLQRQKTIFHSDRIQLLCADVLACTSTSTYREQYDIVFIDPPFHSGLMEHTLTHLREQQMLRPGALIYVESEPGLRLPEGWRVSKQTMAGKVQARLLQIQDTGNKHEGHHRDISRDL